jgi:hypothetical protein
MNKMCVPVAILILATALGTATAARADVVTDWNNAALNAIRAEKTPPPIASRALAVLHTAIYDAVNGISRTHEAYFVQSNVPSSASKEAAAAAAAHRALTHYFRRVRPASRRSMPRCSRLFPTVRRRRGG